MNMRTTIKVTRKGQTTLPAELRRKLKVGQSGGDLTIDYDEGRNQAIISRPITIEELSARATSYIRPGIKPLRDVRGFIKKHRKADQNGYVDDE